MRESEIYIEFISRPRKKKDLSNNFNQILNEKKKHKEAYLSIIYTKSTSKQITIIYKYE
jgi:hypothetical protein